MTNICISGGGFAGLTTALLLASDGHDVTVVEREGPPPSRHPQDAWAAWNRRAVPQFRQTHAYLGRARNLFRSELPHVWARLLEAGVDEYNLATHPPLTIADRSPHPGDDELVYVQGRRSTVESVLHHAAIDDPRVHLISGITTKGVLLRDGSHGPAVTGLATSAGAVDSDLVVDCGGRRSAMPNWLEEAGARRPEEVAAEYRIAYWTQWFKVTEGAQMPELFGPPALEIGPLEVLRVPADDGWFSITIVAPAEDTRFRVLSDQRRLLTFLRRFEVTAAWVDERIAEPIGGILPMFTIVDQRRRFRVDEQVCAAGVVGVGDSIAATNPSLARGTSFALMHGVWLRDLLREEAGPDSIADRYEVVLDEQFEPWWQSTIEMDQARLARMRSAAVSGEADPTPGWIFQHAAMHDPDLWRLALRVRLMLDLPQTVVAQPGTLDRVGEVVGRIGMPKLTYLDVEALLEA